MILSQRDVRVTHALVTRLSHPLSQNPVPTRPDPSRPVPVLSLAKSLHGMPLAKPISDRRSAQGATGDDAMQVSR